ncbi:N-acetylglucosamine kinase [Rhizobium sp. NFR07]|uniref:ROK family protein n=1 Tax=Rhizobium sp. NFR07 TaxID=1566262 RepID=UPI0008E9ED56|nr:ROK family protein [Rhizobium sp. NFR07]SFB48405.1 N-acetylglucosamine kinase [Rhizobium sp. NFR07]
MQAGNSLRGDFGQAVLCADIGGSFIKFGISRQPGHVEELERLPTPKADWRDLAEALQRLADKADPSRSLPLGLSVAGLVDPVNGAGLSANIPPLTGLPIAEAIASVAGRAVLAANDADCLTLAEANDGAGRGYPVVFCIIMGTGIGGGLAIDGRIVRGAGGVTGEWGHGPAMNTSVEIGGRLVPVPRFACNCGQSGCIDTIGGARGMERLHGLFHEEARSSHRIIEDWQAGETKAANTIDAYLQLVADPLAVAINTVGAFIVPVGGGLASAEKLIATLDEAVRARILHRLDRPLLVPAIRREDGGLVGAAVLARQGATDVRAA